MIRYVLIGVVIGSLCFSVQAIQAQSKKQADQQLTLGKPDAPLCTVKGLVTDAAGQPQPKAMVHLKSRAAEIDAHVPTDAEGKFELQVHVPAGPNYHLEITADSSDGARRGVYRLPQSNEASDLTAVRIQLGPVKHARVKVVDSNGQPIVGANVALQLNYPIVMGPVLSDDQGMVSLSLPDSETILSAVAWKDYQGLDYKLYTLPYRQSADQLTKKPQFPIESQETLTLDGASPLSVSIKDEASKPVSEVSSYVWLLKKPDRNDQLNLSYFSGALDQTTNADGTASFAWFPKWQTEPTTVWSSKKGFVRQRSTTDPDGQSISIDVQLTRLVPLRG